MYNPHKEDGSYYVTDPNGKKFRDYNEDPLVFTTYQDAIDWCDTRNEIDKII